MRRPVRSKTRTACLPLVVTLLTVALGGCKDGRGSLTAPDTGVLDGGTLFGSAQVSSAFFGFLNQIVGAVLVLHETPIPVQYPITEVDCTGDSTQTIVLTENNDSDPNTYRITMGNAALNKQFVVNCGSQLQMGFSGAFVIRFLETSQGLDYTISMPFDHATGEPMGVTMQLTQDFGGGIFEITTPFDEDPGDAFPEGSIRYTLSGPRDGGVVHVGGTLRLEDRGIPITLIEELALEYLSFLSTEQGSEGLLLFSLWPGGMYEIVGNGSGGFAGGFVPGYAVQVFFNGVGGASFDFEGHSCQTNMATDENPCEQF